MNGPPERIEPHEVEFSGSGGEFFRVWIVNVLLTVVTLGLYTPFARRRTAQYFYGHTLVAGSPLEFTAQQRKMVVGFLLLMLLYVAWHVATDTGQDTMVAFMMLAGAALAPYFWGSAMRFRFNATRWRGVRLQFAASWREVYAASWPLFAAALVWVGITFAMDAYLPSGPEEASAAEFQPLPALGLFALGLLATVLAVMRLEFNYKSLMVARGRIGGQLGRWKPVFSDFVRIWLATLGVFLATVALVVLGIAIAVGGSIAFFSAIKQGGLAAVFFMFVIGVGAIFLLILSSAPARAYREASLFRLVWSHPGVSQIARFKCELRVWRYVGLRIKNVILTVLTLGFYRPFALVSEYRMKAESVTLHVKGGLDQLAGQLSREEQGLGDAIADAVGLDLVG